MVYPNPVPPHENPALCTLIFIIGSKLCPHLLSPSLQDQPLLPLSRAVENMAEKISTLIIKVDLDCHLCYKKIRKTLCKLQDRENIRTISYDEKKNTVTVSGPFDPEKLTKKLYCKACKVIKDIQTVEPKEKEKPAEKPKDAKSEPAKEKEKPKESKPAEPAKPAKEKEKDKPKEVKPAEPARPAKEKEKEKPKESAGPPKEKEKQKAPPEPVKPVQELPVGIVTQMPGLACPQSWAVGPVCQCGPWYEAHYGGARCYACGRAYGWVSEGPPCDSYRTCHFFSDEDPASTCNVM